MARSLPLNKLKLIGIKEGQNGEKPFFWGGGGGGGGGLDPEMRGEERM